jgi:hypothetical protein
MSRFFDVPFDEIYTEPTPERIAAAYFNKLYRRLNVQNFSLLITFFGSHRVGKSLSAVDFAYILDPTFEKELEKRVIYNTEDLTAVFKDIKTRQIHGAGIIIDEAGSGDLSSQRWYEDVAKIISAELQAIGYLNPFIGFVTQSFSFINSTARKLSQGVFEVERKHSKYNVIKPFWVKNNPWVTTGHRHYPIICEKHGGVMSNVYKISKLRMYLPPKDIVDRYINHSQAYKDQLLDNSVEEVGILNFEKKKKRAFISGIDAIVEEVYINRNDYSTRSSKRGVQAFINKDIIRHAHQELSDREAKTVKALVDQKINQKRTPAIQQN